MGAEMNLMLFVLGACISSVISKQFVFVNQAKTFADAQIYCRQFHCDLASVEDTADFSRLQAAVSGVTDPSVWIGLKRDWVWSLSNSSFYGEGEAEYRRWKAGQLDNNGGNENCGALDIAGEFWDVPCTNQYPFICYDGVKMQILRMKLKSGQNMDDPVMKVSMVDKIQQKLASLGMPENAKLQWRVQSDGEIFHPLENDMNLQK
ncbi:hypothetical protein cypCar_00027091 [Cyprinus carpio]|nr:hypothetical protein cypCar_00027091 [Cyprinus carpio]